MRRIFCLQSIGCVRFGTNGLWCPFEELAKFRSRVRPCALEELGAAGRVVGQRLIGELGQLVLGLLE